jgi:hypothetical protein
VSTGYVDDRRLVAAFVLRPDDEGDALTGEDGERGRLARGAVLRDLHPVHEIERRLEQPSRYGLSVPVDEARAHLDRLQRGDAHFQRFAAHRVGGIDSKQVGPRSLRDAQEHGPIGGHPQLARLAGILEEEPLALSFDEDLALEVVRRRDDEPHEGRSRQRNGHVHASSLRHDDGRLRTREGDPVVGSS